MFLPFPEDWRTVLTVIRRYLRPGGRLGGDDCPACPLPSRGFREHYAEAIARFESERPTMDPERQARRFAELVSQLNGVSPLWGRRPGWKGAARRRRPRPAAGSPRTCVGATPAFARIIEAIFGRSNPVGIDGARIVAVPIAGAGHSRRRSAAASRSRSWRRHNDRRGTPSRSPLPGHASSSGSTGHGASSGASRSVAEVPPPDAPDHEDLVLSVGQHEPRARELQVIRIDDPDERQIPSEHLL